MSLVKQLFKTEAVPELCGKTSASMMFLGEKNDGKELWLSRDDLERHVLIVGASGSGKTNMLLNMLAGALNQGQGYIFIDGKGDSEFPDKARTIAHAFGRQDDFLHLNFASVEPMDANKTSTLENNQTHTFNLLKRMPADVITQVLVSTLEEVGGDGAMWKGRSIAMFLALIGALVWLRDTGKIDLTPGEIRDHMPLDRFASLADPTAFPDMPFRLRKRLRSYLHSLPGYQADKGNKQSQTPLDQHGYLIMQWTRQMSLLADTYGHIFSSQTPDIDLMDVIENHRILVVSLPAMIKHTADVEFLGKFIVSGLRAALFDQHIRNNMLSRSKISRNKFKTPVLCVMDEVSNYMVDGLDLLVSQSRAMGFSLIFSTQTVESMLETSRRITSAILGNTKTKIIMRSETMSNAMAASCLPTGGNPGDDRIADVLNIIRNFNPGEFLVSQGFVRAIGRAPKIEITHFVSAKKMQLLCDFKGIADLILNKEKRKSSQSVVKVAPDGEVSSHEEGDLPFLMELPAFLSELEIFADKSWNFDDPLSVSIDKVTAGTMMNKAALTTIARAAFGLNKNNKLKFYGGKNG